MRGEPVHAPNGDRGIGKEDIGDLGFVLIVSTDLGFGFAFRFEEGVVVLEEASHGAGEVERPLVEVEASTGAFGRGRRRSSGIVESGAVLCRCVW